MHKQRGDVDYLVLFFVVVLAVAFGNLLSNAITAAYVAYQADQAARLLAQNLSERSADAKRESDLALARAAAAQQQRLKEMRQIRATGELGRKLTQSCNDWRKADQGNHTQTTQVEMTKACDHLESYLNTGIWSPDNGK
jgi:hypothetical protein